MKKKKKNSPFFARKPYGPAYNTVRSTAGRLPQGGSSVADAAMEDKMASLASQGSAKMPRGSPRGASLEESPVLQLDFNKLTRAAGACSGLLPVAVQNIDTGEVILLAYTNRKAFSLAMQKRSLILWSASRNELWEKGKTSGETFELAEAYVNCEQNALLYRVRPRRAGVCHTRNKANKPRNCFYRRIDLDTLRLENMDP